MSKDLKVILVKKIAKWKDAQHLVIKEMRIKAQMQYSNYITTKMD